MSNEIIKEGEGIDLPLVGAAAPTAETEALKEDYQDDILNYSINQNRRYRMINHTDGTVSFEDVTQYTQVGDEFGAREINQITGAVNRLNSNLAKPVHDNLWSGTAGDGQTITLSKSIYDYNMIYFSNDTDGIRAMFPVANGVTAIRAGGSTVTTAGNTATFGVTGDVSNEGKTIKITNVAYMTHIASGNNSALTTRKITRVFGIR